MREEKIYRETWIEIDLAAVGYNIRQIKNKLPKETNWMAVVKANGYGHGAVEVAREAMEAGATMLAVALLEEAMTLREAGIKEPILVFGRVPAIYASVAAKHHITLTVFQKEWIQEVQAQKLTTNLSVHMKWDTGMGRVGVRTEDELKGILDELNKKNSIHLTGVYTHFATADEEDDAYFKQQMQQFKKQLALFQSEWKKPVMIHIGNSAATIRNPNDMYDCIRLGIAMYGIYPSEVVKEERAIELKPAFSLHSRIVHIKKIQENEAIGYGAAYKATKSEWIGTIAIGYGDGWSRSLQGASVLVDGKRRPIVGRISMDQLTISLDKEYPVGTKVTLIGKQNNEVISVDEIAAHLETINYEIPCMINQRIPRIYNGGAVTAIEKGSCDKRNGTSEKE